MKFNQDKLKETLSSIDPSVSFLAGPRKEAFSKWLSESNIPSELSTLLTDHIPTKFINLISCGCLYEDKSIIEANNDHPKMIEQGYIQVGHAPNGDQIVIDFKNNGRSGYISHDEFYEEYEEIKDNMINEMFIPVADSIGTMVYELKNNPDFPIDIYEAEDKGFANQQVEPTLKTPVESGNEQGSAAHP